MLRFLFVFSVPTFSSYNPDIAKKGASPGGVTPLRWRARGPNQGGGTGYRTLSCATQKTKTTPSTTLGDSSFTA